MKTDFEKIEWLRELLKTDMTISVRYTLVDLRDSLEILLKKYDEQRVKIEEYKLQIKSGPKFGDFNVRF